VREDIVAVKEDDLWVEHDDYGPSKPQRKVGRHERLPSDTVLVNDNLDHDPRVTHGSMGDGDDLMRLRIGEEAVVQATPAFREVEARTNFQSKPLLDVDDQLDNSLEVDPVQPDRTSVELDESVTE